MVVLESRPKRRCVGGNLSSKDGIENEKRGIIHLRQGVFDLARQICSAVLHRRGDLNGVFLRCLQSASAFGRRPFAQGEIVRGVVPKCYEFWNFCGGNRTKEHTCNQPEQHAASGASLKHYTVSNASVTLLHASDIACKVFSVGSRFRRQWRS